MNNLGVLIERVMAGKSFPATGRIVQTPKGPRKLIPAQSGFKSVRAGGPPKYAAVRFSAPKAPKPDYSSLGSVRTKAGRSARFQAALDRKAAAGKNISQAQKNVAARLKAGEPSKLQKNLEARKKPAEPTKPKPTAVITKKPTTPTDAVRKAQVARQKAQRVSRKIQIKRRAEGPIFPSPGKGKENFIPAGTKPRETPSRVAGALEKYPGDFAARIAARKAELERKNKN